MIEQDMVISIPFYPPYVFLVLTPSCRTLSQLPRDEDMRKCPNDRNVLCRSVDSRHCEYCNEFYRYHAEEY